MIRTNLKSCKRFWIWAQTSLTMYGACGSQALKMWWLDIASAASASCICTKLPKTCTCSTCKVMSCHRYVTFCAEHLNL